MKRVASSKIIPWERDIRTCWSTRHYLLSHHYNRTFKAEQYKGLKEKKASRSSSHLCDIL